MDTIVRAQLFNEEVDHSIPGGDDTFMRPSSF